MKEHAKNFIKYYSPLSFLIFEAVEKSSQAVSSISDGSIEQLENEVKKRSIELDFAKKQAQIEQEMAIARRIDNAEEVEIEEFYDLSGSGNAGIGIDASSRVTAGISGEGKKVSKRIYRFKSKTSLECAEKTIEN